MFKLHIETCPNCGILVNTSEMILIDMEIQEDKTLNCYEEDDYYGVSGFFCPVCKEWVYI